MMENIKILILLLIFSCNPQESNGHKKENPILKIEYNFLCFKWWRTYL